MRTLALLALAACTPEGPGPAPSSSDTESPSSSSTTSDPGPSPTTPGEDTAGTDTGANVPPWELVQVDCTAGNPLPLAYESLTFVQGSEDFTFDDQGYQIGVSGGNLQRTAYEGVPEVTVPGVGDVRGTRFLPDDTLVLATYDQGVVLNVDPATGAEQVVASGLTNPNGVAIRYDGWVYVAVLAQIIRFDPAVGQVEVVVDAPGKSFDGVSFSPDFARLYFNEEVGRIHWVDIAADGSFGPMMDGPLLPIGGFSILDGMAVDACGNLYVTEMGGVVWRVAPDGAVEQVVNLAEALAIIPALNFGTGIGGWDAETLYVMDFKGTLYALDVGLPGKWEPHWPLPSP